MSSNLDSSHSTRNVGPIFIGVIVLSLLVGVSLTGRADPYQEATADLKSVVDSSYFGTHFHRLVLNPGEKNLQTFWPASRIGAIRLWDSGTLWSEIAIQPGQWKFDRIDTYVEQAVAHNTAVLYVLGGTPRWASARRDEKCPYGLGCAAEPVRMAHWEEYVRRVVQRYRGRIKTYELWNEPNFSDIPRDRNAPGFYTGSVADMVEMARLARKVLDDIDPDAVLSTPGFVNGPDRLELFLEAGGKKYIQAIAYHFYSDNSEVFARQIVDVHAIMKRHGLEKLPLWNTETGVEASLTDTPEIENANRLTPFNAASRLAQYLILGSAAGLEHFYHYAWDNPRTGMLTQSGERLPNQDSYEKVQAWLLGSTMLGCRKVMPQGVVCDGQRDGSRFSIAWSENKGAYYLPIPSGWITTAQERLFDNREIPLSSKKQDKHVRVELDQQPVLIKYLPRL